MEEIKMGRIGILMASILLLLSGAATTSKVDAARTLAGQSIGPEGSPVEFEHATRGLSAKPRFEPDVTKSDAEGVAEKGVMKVKLLIQAANQAGINSSSCYPKITYAIMLANTLGQVRHVNGIDIRGDHQMEIYVNPKTRTWTLVLIIPSGLACKIGNGTEILIEPLPHGS